ncbi:NADP-dependent 3-hydroxy acid dehydrogenase YdfG [Alteribacillus persepolensis]|uniref:NADP-dependent 3-hydroxy acid dehydrogenase YdfG n=1 Tax=Alteribacillus persepolensis TaxID=568899 RepID=A0A1G7Z7Z4_9BACI|nr:SDR family oxidoreductase [Alteribacillus persepolensis]SDH04725.1 NADP-dependent 3-hydroxy acid dehydrogenase YdfG [Alteribacillus persepolensis]
MIQNKSIIITGASSGIGAAAAKKLHQHGANLVLAARRKERLSQLQAELTGEGKVFVFEADVTSLENMQELAAFTLKTYGKIDVLFNNAGVMPLSYMKNKKIAEWYQMIDVNIKGVLNGFAAVSDHMLERNEGHVITTSSDAAHKVFPGSAVYSGTKHAVHAIMQGLKMEMAHTNIRFTAISPGAVATELTDSITDQDILDNMKEGMPFSPLDSENIADAVYYAVSQPLSVDVNEIVVRPNHQGS